MSIPPPSGSKSEWAAVAVLGLLLLTLAVGFLWQRQRAKYEDEELAVRRAKSAEEDRKYKQETLNKYGESDEDFMKRLAR